jgi:hypothetical protein
MKALTEFLNEGAYPKSEKGWDKKFKDIKSILITSNDYDIDSEEFIERIQQAGGVPNKENNMSGKLNDKNFEKIADEAWSKLKGDVTAKQKALEEYIDGGWV